MSPGVAWGSHADFLGPLGGLMGSLGGVSGASWSAFGGFFGNHMKIIMNFNENHEKIIGNWCLPRAVLTGRYTTFEGSHEIKGTLSQNPQNH